MAPDGIFARAVAALIQWGEHNEQSATRFLGRCSIEEAKSIAAAKTATEFEDAMDAALDRMEENGARQN